MPLNNFELWRDPKKTNYIAVRTRMRKMPKVCEACRYYRPRCAGWGTPTCNADVNPVSLRMIKVTATRPDWCPLVEIKENIR